MKLPFSPQIFSDHEVTFNQLFSPYSAKRERIPAVIKGHRHFGYGGAVLPESVTIEQYYDLTPTKKSNLRMNDQLVPKPTDIDMSERMIKAAVPKEHPYQSHISRYAVFPSYQSPDDPHTGVRAASTLALNPLLPSSAPVATVLHKTKGSPHRHKILDVPMATRREAVIWPGQHGFQNGGAQMFYPTPLKTVCPNASLRNWNTTLSERSANMLHNLEKAQWLTSYQLHYTGTGPANPIKLDDFHEKTIAMITGEMNPLTTQLRAEIFHVDMLQKERSIPTFVSSRPLEGRKAKVLQKRPPLESTYASFPCPPATSAPSGPADPHLTPPHKLNPSAVKVREQNITVQKSAPGKKHLSGSYKSETGKSGRVIESNQSYEDTRSDPGFGNTTGYCEICGEKMCLCRTERSDLRYTETLPADYSSFDTHPEEIHTYSELYKKEQLQTMKSQPEKGIEYLSKSLQPRSFKEAGKKSLHNRADLQTHPSLLELQDSFRKSEAHRRFHESIKGAEVDLRDNHHTGRKHTFYGFNSYFFYN